VARPLRNLRVGVEYEKVGAGDVNCCRRREISELDLPSQIWQVVIIKE